MQNMKMKFNDVIIKDKILRRGVLMDVFFLLLKNDCDKISTKEKARQKEKEWKTKRNIFETLVL